MSPELEKLTATSALVLLWAGEEGCRSERGRRYLSRLDLSGGRELFQRCNAIWPHYGEVIRNRKFGVRHLIESCFAGETGCAQLVIAGAGLDPLGIEAAERYPRAKVFELDQKQMGRKTRVLDDPGMAGKGSIAFIEIDLISIPGLESKLTAAGWVKSRPTALVLEGISYYLPEESLRKLARAVNPRWIIFEFLKEEGEIAPGRAEIPRRVFDLIAKECELPLIRRYNYPRAEELFGMPAVDRYGMKRLEKLRTGENRFFSTEESGWIEVCLLE